jgi:predicted porin
MKKSLFALAVLGAFAGVTQAQTAVTIYGSFDGGIRYMNHQNAAGDALWSQNSAGTYNSNRLGFKGVEDLGGGLNAHFNLEQRFNGGDGTLAGVLFNGAANVGLGGNWGSVDLGRQYSANFKVIGLYDPFNYKYTGIDPLATQGGLTRLNNDVQYTGVFGPVTAYAEHAFGEVAGSASNGSTNAVGLAYSNGPLAIGGAYTGGKRNITAAPVAANFQDMTNWTVGGAYKFGPARVTLGYADNKQTQAAGVADLRNKNAWVGLGYDISPVVGLTAGYFDTKFQGLPGGDGKRQLLMVGGTYALSKRTNFYADIDSARYKDAAIGAAAAQVSGQLPNANDRTIGVSVGINHLF